MTGDFREITATLLQHKEAFFARYRVSEMGVFGSYARGEERKRSDVDILVEFHKVPDLLTFIQAETHLRKLLRRKVDLVRKGAIRPELRDQILKEVIYL